MEMLLEGGSVTGLDSTPRVKGRSLTIARADFYQKAISILRSIHN
jgi:hypothetical protein